MEADRIEVRHLPIRAGTVGFVMATCLPPSN